MTRGQGFSSNKSMFTMSIPSFFAGIDWGSQTHQACVLNADGEVLGERAFAHSGKGLGQLIQWMLKCAGCDAGQVSVAIEVPHGPVVDSLLDRGFRVFSINPKQLDRFRDRFSPAGAKDDRRDARVLASALRTDPACLRRLHPMDPEVVKLRDLSRAAEELTAQRTRLSNRIRQQLWRYFPQFLGFEASIYEPWLLALWERVPTPAMAQRIRQGTIAKLLKDHRIRRITAEEVFDALRAEPVTVAPGVEEAAVSRIRLYAEQLVMVNRQLKAAKKALMALIKDLSTTTTSDTPSDAAILLSMPGVGPAVVSALLSEAPGLLLMRDYHALRCLCGTAPVTRRSGKSRYVVRRRASHRRLVNAIYHWSRVASMRDPVCKAKYDALRKRGHTHPRALRSVADRLLAIACAMLESGTLFDPEYKKAAA